MKYNLIDSSSYFRVCLKSVKGSEVLVHFIDFGNDAKLPVDQLRDLDAKYQTKPIQAHECMLHGIAGQLV